MMSDEQIFEHLFNIATKSKDPKGVVSACIVENGNILFSSASSDDGVHHAEELVIDIARNHNIDLTCVTLYITLEPCTKRTNPSQLDCTALIIKSGIKFVVYGASDPDHSGINIERLSAAGIGLRQVSDQNIVNKCAEIFNASVSSEYINVGVKLKPIR